MNLSELREATSEGFSLVLEALQAPHGDREELISELRTLVCRLEAPGAPMRRDCRGCGMQVADMQWHPADSRNVCPGCGRPL